LGANSNVPVLVTNSTGLSGVTAIAAGGSHTCVVAGNGAMWCWGYNAFGQLGDNSITQRNEPLPMGSLPSNAATVCAGNHHTCAITGAGDAGTGGALQCWGSGASGQLGNGMTAMALTPGPVTNLGSGVLAVTCGLYHTCALTTGGGLQCWGDDGYGEVGNAGLAPDGGPASQLVPIGVTGLGSGVLSFSAGNDYTCAVTSAGVAQCWGYNGNGEIGNGMIGNGVIDTPVNVHQP
jgi:alpha-tubulin suppressor-like RCC1 family protein